MPSSIKPGIYRLIVDLPAIDPDRRVRYDWRNAPMKAGTLFAVRDERGTFSESPSKPILELSVLYGYAHQRVFPTGDTRVGALVEHLEPVLDPSATDYLAFIGRPHAASVIIDMLMERGLLTTKGIDLLLAERDAKNREGVDRTHAEEPKQ